MKSFLMMIVLAATPAMAMSYGEGNSQQPEVEYLSWCDGNNVMSEDSQGQVSIRDNCSNAGLVCRATQIYRMHRTLVSATCGE